MPPGFSSARRWVDPRAPAGTGKYLATYELERPQVLETPEYLAHVGEHFTPWSKRCLSRCVLFRRWACAQILPGDAAPGDEGGGEAQVHRWQLERLRQWAQGLDLERHRVSFHVLEARDPAEALLDYVRVNRASLMILGAATHGLKTQRLVATVPVRVAMNAPCSVMLVKQSLPFEHLGRAGVPADTPADTPAATMDHVVPSL